MKKRFISLFLCIVIIASMIQLPAFATKGTDGEIVVSAKSTNLEVGETTDVTFKVRALGDAIGAINFTVNMPEGLEYVEHEILVSQSDYMMSSYTPEDGKFGCAVTASGKTGEFNVLKLTVRAKEQNTGENLLATTIGSMLKVDGATIMDFGTIDTININTYSKITGNLPIAITAPVKGAVPQTTITADSEYTGRVTWEGNPATFAASTAYTADVTLTAAEGYRFVNAVNPTVVGTTKVTNKTVASDGSTLTFKVSFPTTENADALSGTVTIDKTSPKFGETLTAQIDSLNYGSETRGMLTYQWYRNDSKITNATGSTYTIDADDMGKTIKVEVKNSNNSGSVASVATAAVARADYSGNGAIAATVDKTHDTVTVKNVVDGQEYAIAAGDEQPTYNGNTTGEFTGLNPNTAYKVYTRVIATLTTNASAAVCTDVTTDKAPAGTPVTPVVTGKTDTSVTVTKVGGQKYCIKKANETAPVASAADWADTVTFNGLDRNTAYKIYTYIPEGASTDASAVVYTEVTTEKTTITNTLVSVSELTGKIYSAAVQEPTFGGSLTKGTDYTVSYSVKNGVNGALDNGKPIGAGTYIVTITGTGDYTGSFTKDFTINKKEVTITPNSGQSKTFGENDPEITYTTDLTGALATAFNADKSGALGRADGENVGAYAINIGTLTAGNNFDITLSTPPINFSINVKNVTESRAAATQSVVKGVGSFTAPTFGAVTGTLAYNYDGATTYAAIVEKLKTLSADATGTITYSYTASGNYTGTITGSINFTVVDIAFDIASDAITVDNNPTYGDTWGQIVRVNSAKITAKVGTNTCADPTYTLMNSTEKPESGSQTYTITFSGEIAGNTYTNVTVKSDTVSIAKKTLTANDLEFVGVTPITKTYDGNTTAIATVQVKDSAKINTSDVLPVVSGTYAYNSKDVLTATTVTFTSAAAESTNYVLPADLTVNANGTIQPKEVTLTAGIGAVTKPYDGNPYVYMQPIGTPAFTGLVDGESLSIGYSAVGTVQSADVEDGKTVTYTVTLYDADSGEGKASNYRLNTTLPAVTVNITKATPTVNANDITATYTGEAPAITGTAVSGNNSVAGTWSFKETAPVKVADSNENVAVVFTPSDSKNYDTVEDTISVTINKATPTGKPTCTSINESGKTLADSTISVGSILPAGGTIAWNDAAETSVTANTAYGWTYTPADTDAANYNTLTGTLTPYVVHYGGGGGGAVTPTAYSITKDKTENGSIALSSESAVKGDNVIITATPDKGYELDTLTVLDKNGKEIKLTEKDGKYTFEMPASKVTVKATFKKIAAVNPFSDVKTGDYFYDAVLWAVENNITSGTSDTTFSPNAPCTRGQIVTFLWRAAGSPEPKNAASFEDIDADAYYAKAVAWAVENGITVGTSETTFSPDAVCSRAQAVTFLSRALKGKANAGGSAFSDVDADSYYAEAVAWAVDNGIVKGTTTTTFSPDDVCTRGQIVTLLFRAMAE